MVFLQSSFSSEDTGHPSRTIKTHTSHKEVPGLQRIFSIEKGKTKKNTHTQTRPCCIYERFTPFKTLLAYMAQFKLFRQSPMHHPPTYCTTHTTLQNARPSPFQSRAVSAGWWVFREKVCTILLTAVRGKQAKPLTSPQIDETTTCAR